MATTRIKDISKTTTDLASDTYGVFDGSTNGTQKMSRDDMYADWAAAYVAAPTTYKLAPLNSGTNKIDATYLPTGADTAKGEWDANANSPSLADGTGTAGDYYDVTTAGTQDLGSGSIDYTVGDVVKYDGSVWYKIDSVANILDGSATAADGRDALSVNSKDEDAQANALKTTAPAMYFDGSSYVTVSDDDKLSFSSLTEFGTDTAGTWSPEDNTPALTDGTGTLNDHYKIDADGTVAQGGSTLSIIDGVSVTAGQVVYYDGSVWRVKDADDLPFSISGWVNINDTGSSQILLSKYGSLTTTREYYVSIGGVSDNALLRVYSSSAGGYISVYSPASSLPVGEWCHVAFVYKGSGPNSSVSYASAYSDATQVIDIYINGVLQSGTQSNYVGFSGMSNTTIPVYIGRESAGNYVKGSIRGLKIFNKELTSTEIAELARGNDLGFSEEWGGAIGGAYTSDFSSTTDSFTTSATSLSQIGGTIDGRSNLLRIAGDGTSAYHAAIRNVGATVGKRYRITLDYDIQGSNTVVDGVRMRWNNGTEYSSTGTSAGAWGRIEFESIATDASFEIYMMDGASQVNAAPATDYIYVSGVTITEIGTLADFRAERYDTSTNKLYDISDNAFVGTGTSVSLTGREVPVYSTGTWTPTITFGGGSTGVTYTTQEGLYTRIGDTVWVSAYVLLSAKGSDTGTALVNGLPFTASNSAASSQSLTVGNAANAANLTSAITAYVTDNGTTINLVDWGATGSAVLDDTNFAATTALSITGTYKIQ